MKSKTHLVKILLVFIVFTLVGLFPHSLIAEKLQADSSKKAIVTTEEQKTTLITIYSWSTILPKELIDLQNQIAKKTKVRLIEAHLSKLSAEIDAIKWDTTIAKTSPELQSFQLAGLQERAQRFEARINKITGTINDLISYLSESRKEWLKKKENILSIETEKEIPLILADEQYEKLIKTVDEAIRLIEENLKATLLVGKEIADLQIALYSIDSALGSLDFELRKTTIQQTAPSMLSGEFYSRINYNLFSQSFNRTRLFTIRLVQNIQEQIHYLFLGCLGFTFLCMTIYWTQQFSPPESRWRSFAQLPIATAIFIGSSINAITNIFPLSNELPKQWEALLHIFTIFAVMRLTQKLIADKEKRKLLNQLSFFLAMTMVLLLLGLPQIVILLYAFYVSIVVFLYYLSQLPATRGKNLSEVWLQKVWGILPAIVIVSGVAGYDQLAVMVFSIFLSTVITFLIMWVLYMVNLGLLELVLFLLPFPLIKENFVEIIKSIRPILSLLHTLILITILTIIWDIYPTFHTAFYEINNFGFNLGDLRISLKFIFTVVLVFYGALLTSKAIQAFLLQNVLPRYKAEKGVQISIVRLVHYAILTVGFIIMLRVLGFQLNQITLLGGALGVGIGFGLQAIVTNFASGLILLFERPIKVGDTIQLGTEWGEVKQLGLRATIIQTFDNAEIVVPNSDLITGQVTNWTLADRKVRVKIPIGVAYGTDVGKVIEILISCGMANPMVLNTPKPNALFLAFGASSLDFELRVWIPEFLNKLQVLSDLNQDIESELALNNIEIPFPQSDLHLRSVDEDAGEQIRGKTLPLVASSNEKITPHNS